MMQHVHSEMEVAAQDLVRPFAGIDNFISGIPNSSAEQVFRNSVAIDAQSFRMPDCVCKIVCDIGLPDRNGMKVCAGKLSHFTSDLAFIISRLVKCERKCLNR